MMPEVGHEPDVCDSCVRAGGLCDRHHVGVLPLLARNIGWLRLMGNAAVEQTKRQTSPEDTATKKAKRRNVRKERRGYVGLLAAIRAA